jgi:hypothetical protein
MSIAFCNRSSQLRSLIVARIARRTAAPRSTALLGRPRVAIIPHVGVAMGHLLRAIALGRLLENDCEILFVVPSRAKRFIAEYFPDVQCAWVRWSFGHNDAIDHSLSETIDRSKQTLREIGNIFNAFRPQVVFGLPGFQTSFACELLGVPHVSLMHGPWLTPEYDLTDLSRSERSLISGWKRAIQVTDTLLLVMAHALGYNYRGYRHWLESHRICAAQGFSVTYRSPRPVIGFLHLEYGPATVADLPDKCISVLFGTAIREVDCDLLRAISGFGLPLVVVGARHRRPADGIFWVRSMSASRLADISAIAITHGGIGTIPTFARAGVPQIFVPHDIDQALNAVLAARSAFGEPIRLDYWRDRSPFGRVRPTVDSDDVRRLILNAHRTPRAITIAPVDAAKVTREILCEIVLESS